MRVTPKEQAGVAAAIRAVEARSDAEVSAIVATSSDTYNDVVLHWALLAALFPLAAAAAYPAWLDWLTLKVEGGWTEHPSQRVALTLLLVLTVALFLIKRWSAGLAPFRLWLTPAATKARRVRRRAILLFRAGTERRTASRTGVLVYLSLAERRAEIVADAAIHARVAPELWGEAMTALLEGVSTGRPGAGIAAAIARIGDVLAEHFPHTGGDPNELPDRLIEL